MVTMSPPNPYNNFLEFHGFDIVNARKPLSILFISISCGEPHCPFAPTLPQ